MNRKHHRTTAPHEMPFAVSHALRGSIEEQVTDGIRMAILPCLDTGKSAATIVLPMRFVAGVQP